MSEVTAVPLRPIKKGSLTILWIGIGLAAAVAIGFAWKTTQGQVQMAMTPAQFLESNKGASGVVTLPSGVQYKVLEAGDPNGRKPGPGDLTRVEYEGKLADGRVFDASALHDTPAIFPVTGMIPGWSEGIQQMNTGAKYRFWIPPELGFGPQGAADKIPPNALLIFDVKLLEVLQQPAMGGGMGGGGMPPGHGDVVPPAGGM